MKKQIFTVLKALGITAGLNLLLLLCETLLAPAVKTEIGQASLLLLAALGPVVGTCLYAVLPVRKRSTLWVCFGLSLVTHLVLTAAVVLIGGSHLSDLWPGRGNLAWLLFALIHLTAWCIALLTVTLRRTVLMGSARREETRRVKQAKKGYRREWETLSPGRSRVLGSLRGFLWVVRFYLLTGLLLWILDGFLGMEQTMLAYIAFPSLWCVLAALYSPSRGESRPAYTLTAAVSHLFFFLLSSYLLMLGNTPDHPYRFVLHLDSVLTKPFRNYEQLLAVALLLGGLAVIIIFSIGNRRHPDPIPTSEPAPADPAEAVPAAEPIPVASAETVPVSEPAPADPAEAVPAAESTPVASAETVPASEPAPADPAEAVPAAESTPVASAETVPASESAPADPAEAVPAAEPVPVAPAEAVPDATEPVAPSVTSGNNG